MHIIRPSHPDDTDILLKMAKMVHFINLPADKDIIAEKIARSRASFRKAAAGDGEINYGSGDESATSGSPIFMFTIADSESDACVGTAMIIAKMGQPGHPNVSFELQRREFFSHDLQSGATHTVARLFLDESGKTEIGGLILGPSMRRHPEKLGKQLSLIRFHYIGAHRKEFSDHMLAEMMAPITPDGRNTFWEHFGRRFINLTYVEADKFCQHSREFMTSLLPREDVYLTLLPPEARQGIAQVGRDTVPARRMLESLGFKYVGRIDPFDGGPHLEVETDDISLVRHTGSATFAGVCEESATSGAGFVSVESTGVDFRALHAPVQIEGSEIRLPEEYARALRIDAGARVAFTPLDLRRPLNAADPTQPSHAAPDGAPASDSSAPTQA